MDVLEGAYSLVIMSATKLIAVRDPRGYRPLCIGTLPGGGYVFASESCALDAAGASLLRDVEPGEIVVADTRTGELRSIKDHCGRKDTQMCVFEYIYFSRPDSIIEGSSVHEARKQAGRFLAQEHPVEADVVIGVPDSGLDAALGYSEESGIPYGIGFIKNKYIGRTFIQGSQKQRENSVRIKLNVVSSTVKGKRVVLVDDSIVRGTTSARIIKLLRDAGAAEVHFRVSAPPFKYPCYFGTDIPDQKLLVATGRTVEQINEVIGVPDSGLDAALGYSQESGIPYGIGFIKNKYIGRTFIQGSQKQRENSVRIKLNAISSTVKGKRVVLVDDSIVRGTTSARIIKLLRDAGATEVHFMVSAPPFKYPCYFGTDIPDQKLLVATGRTVDQINEIIGADTLGYLSTEHVVQLAKNANCGFCTACFTGEYAVKPDEVLSTDIHERHLNDRPKDAKKLGE